MFSNIGGKIKVTAKVFCWIGIIVSVVGGLGMIVAGGVGTALLGSLLSWVGSFVMVGFGELIENTAEIAANTRKSGY